MINWKSAPGTYILIFPQPIKPPASALVDGRRADQGPIRARLPASPPILGTCTAHPQACAQPSALPLTSPGGWRDRSVLSSRPW